MRFLRPLVGSMLIHVLVVGGFVWAAWNWPVEPTGQMAPAPGLMLVELVGGSPEATEQSTVEPSTAPPPPSSQPIEPPDPMDSSPVEAVASLFAIPDRAEPPLERSSSEGAGETAAVVSLGSADLSAPAVAVRLGEEDEWDAFYEAVRAAIERAKRYPPSARRAGQEDRVTISFLVLPDGQAEELEVVAPSQYPILNRAAVETVQRVVRFPSPPASADRTARVIIPLVFALHEEEN